MRVPRRWSGADLKKALAAWGYEETRQTGSHVRLTTQMRGIHHVTVPDHKVLPLGTLKSILRDVARHFECTPDEILARLLGPQLRDHRVFSPMRAGGFAILGKRECYGHGVTGKRPRLFEHQLPPGLRLRRRGGPG